MTFDGNIDMLEMAFWQIILSSGPVLLIALAIGLFIGIFQAATSINEITIRTGVGTPFIPNKGADIIKAPILTVDKRNSGSKLIMLDKYKPGNGLTLLFNRLNSNIS
jgi:hypothetical protein